MPNILLPSLLAALAGASSVIQQILNANLRGSLNSAAWSGFVSYFVGLACMALVLLCVRDPLPSVSLASRIPWWAWSGGLFGAIFVVIAILFVPRLGAATFIALFVTGQMLTSMAFDQFGWLGLAQRAIDGPRLLGVLLLVGGVICIGR